MVSNEQRPGDAEWTVRLLNDVAEHHAAQQLFDEVWATTAGSLVNAGLMTALAHSGSYVAGAFAGDRMVGASVAFLAAGDPVSLHSHITGVRSEVQARGVGLAMKLHQRAWARSKGMREISWTFDPLVRRNALFNLARLGATAVDYVPDFYGPMGDGINAGQGSDRILVHWDVTTPQPYQRVATPLDVAPALVVGDGERPVVRAASATTRSLALPADIVGMRQRDPGLAELWRQALREQFLSLVNNGYRVVTFDAGLGYVLSGGAG